MNLWQLVASEIKFRKLGFFIGVISVAVAIGSLVGAITLLRAHDACTELLLAEKAAATRAEMDRMEDDYRRIMKQLGHNVMILHAGQSLAALRAGGCPDTDMPEEYVEKLARSSITTLNHLLPVLQGKYVWPEYGLEVILRGTPGQVPVYHRKRFLTADGRAYLDPIVEAVPEKALNIGGGVARELGLRAGDNVVFNGGKFRVHQVLALQGNQDDLAVWCSLERAQAWLAMSGRINVIFALECICHASTLGKITEEVGRILPDVQIVEFSSLVTVRADARERAAAVSRETLENERAHKQKLGAERRKFAALLVPLLLTASGVWVFFLILGNVRERRAEIGILRALGVRSARIYGIFMIKAALIGLLGALAGYPAGVLAGAHWGGITVFSGTFAELISPWLFAAAILIALGICVMASLIPALIATEYDPAVTLREG